MANTPETARMAAKSSFRILEITSFAAQPAPAQGHCRTNLAQSPGAMAKAFGGAFTTLAMARNLSSPTTHSQARDPEAVERR
jgi:hypothetical protein